jgi:hypothetical protein
MPLPPPGADWFALPITLDQARAQYPREEVVVIEFLIRDDDPPYLVGHGIDAGEAWDHAHGEAVRVYGPQVPIPDPLFLIKYGVATPHQFRCIP